MKLCLLFVLLQPTYVASIKSNHDVVPRSINEYQQGGRFTGTAVTVRTLFRLAFQLPNYLTIGAPSWVDSNRYDIAAKSDLTPAPSQSEFVLILLQDRFQLVFHRETRELPRYALVLARADRKLGNRLNQSTFDCDAYRAAPHNPPAPGQIPPCGTFNAPFAIAGKALTLAQLATSLAGRVDAPVIDRTGLAGRYDIDLKFSSDTPSDSIPTPITTLIFAALTEQLGLKLVSEKGPAGVVVIDRIAEPSPNQ